MSAPVQTIVLAGRDAGLWLSALLLQRSLVATGIKIVVVELPSRAAAGTVHTTLPALEALHNRLDIDESQLLAMTGGSFSLGWNIVPPAPAKPYFLAHGSYGTPLDGFLFLPFWVKATTLGLGVAFEDFCPTAMAARQGRLLFPDAETEAFGRTNYGYHLPALPYAALLKTAACATGIEHRQTLSLEVERDGDRIRALRLDGGERIDGDLFLDVSGDERILAAGQPGRHPDSPLLAADRRLVARGPRLAGVPAFGELRLVDDGYAILQSSQAGTELGFCYRSDLLADEQAPAAASAAAGFPLAETRIEPLEARLDKAPWAGNCIALGAAACRLEPLFDLDLQILQLGLVHLLTLVPTQADFAVERDEYNRIVGSSLDRLRDLPELFFALARGESPFWRRARATDPSPALAHRIATFAARGEIPPLEDESFPLDFWQALCIGQGLVPRSWSPLADRLPLEQLNGEFRRMLMFIKDKVLKQPTHGDYLAGLGSAGRA